MHIILSYRVATQHRCKDLTSIFWEDVDRQAEESTALAPTTIQLCPGLKKVWTYNIFNESKAHSDIQLGEIVHWPWEILTFSIFGATLIHPKNLQS